MVQSVCACLQSIRRQVCIVQRAAADLNPHLPLDLIEILLQQHERIVRLVPTTYACSDTQIQITDHETRVSKRTRASALASRLDIKQFLSLLVGYVHASTCGMGCGRRLLVPPLLRP